MAKRIFLTAILFIISALVSPSPITADAPTEGVVFYTVAYGDSLASIAAGFGAPVESIVALNGLKPDSILYVGRNLRVPVYAGAPSAAPTYFAYVVRYGDTLSNIAWRYGVSIAALMRANRIYNPNFIYAGMRLLIPRVPAPPTRVPPPSYTTYIVQRGDTLSGLAVRFGTTVYALMIANNIANPNLIFVGMQLFIPGSGAVRTPTPGALTPPALTPTPTPPTVAVVMQNLSFVPNRSTVRARTVIQWFNVDSVQHTITSGAPGAQTTLFDSGNLGPGQTFAFFFATPGTYAYFCKIHGTTMTGTITVTP